MVALGRAVLCVLAVIYIGIAHGQGNEGGTGTTGVTLPNTDVCGKRGGSSRVKRVIGGSDADPGMFPWLAALGYRSVNDSKLSWLCAGTLVTDRHVVTAAQCVVGASPRYVLSVVRLGVVDFSNRSATQTDTDYEVDSWTLHPGYNRSEQVDDIAIVKLKNKVTFSRLIQPICLPTLDELKTKNFTGSAGYIAGWGSTAYRGEKPVRLQQAQLHIWDQQKCKEAYSGLNKAVIDYRVFCAADDGKDSCQGDSGAPLMMPYGPDSNYYLYGVVSYGRRCADPQFPGVYTRVPEFMDWMLQNLK